MMTPDVVQFWADLLDRIGLGMTAVDAEGYFRSWNGTMHTLLGWDTAEVIGKVWYDVVGGPDAGGVSNIFPQAVLAGQPWEGEFTARTRDGHTARLRAVAGPLVESGHLGGAIALVSDHETPAAPTIEVLLTEMAHLRAVLERGHEAPDLPGADQLTPRELDVLDLLSRGLRVPTIAIQLGVSESTVRNHLGAIFRKLGVCSQRELLERLNHREG